MKTMDQIIAKIALPIIGIAAVLLILAVLFSSQTTNQENNGYIRVINCVVSIPPSIRTQGQTEECYTKVEKDLGIRLQRYDSSAQQQ